jgi:hypothetical protein
MNQRFKVGDRVRVVGVLGTLYRVKTGRVVTVELNADGLHELDLYGVHIPGVAMGDTKLADFQLALVPEELP